jgi:hypothetical protein
VDTPYPLGGWAEIPHLPGFHASNEGAIANRKGKILSQWHESKRGALRVRIKGRNRAVGFLVLTAFTGVPPRGFYVRYRNGDKTDNTLENLMWASPGK